MAQCPHCGKEAGAQHFPACPKRPALRASILQLLTDVAHPGCAVSKREYEKRRIAAGVTACSDRGLITFYGSWPAACAAYGLKIEHGEKLRRKVCPHCGMESSRIRIAYHIGRCQNNPVVKERIIAALRSPAQNANEGEGATRAEYSRRADADDTLPSARTLTEHCGGTWDKVLAHYGLVLVKHSVMLECPHCGRNIARGGWGMHAKACAGGTAEERAELGEVEKEEQARQSERRILADDAARAHSLAVARVKPAPGLRVNGRECVRLELR
jgi:predicted RNA-binding Zn-ribbon protein involved in translation (DUF1610 family)